MSGGGQTTPPLLDVEDLRIEFPVHGGTVKAVRGASFQVRPGAAVAVVGESGSGKSVLSMSIMGILPRPGRITGGAIRFADPATPGQVVDLARLDPGSRAFRAIRGGRISIIFQEPMTSLSPLHTIGNQIIEAVRLHRSVSAREAAALAEEMLGHVGFPHPARALRTYPFELSGGLRQRAMIAMALVCRPALLIADEPTTALDVTIQAQIRDLMVELNRDFGAAIILISHALGVIASVCRRVLVMYAGEVVEEGPTEQVLANPRHPYTWALINAVPRIDRHLPGTRRLTTIEGAPPDALAMPSGCRFSARCPFRISKCDEHPSLEEVAPGRKARCWVTRGGELLPPASPPPPTVSAARPAAEKSEKEPLLSVRGLVKHFPLRKDGLFAPRKVVHAVDGVDLDVEVGETVGIVGESGCGKSTFARLVMRIHEPTDGAIRFSGHDIAKASPSSIRPLRRHMQMVFQDPYASLNPRMTVGEILSEPLRFHKLTGTAAETAARVEELLASVGLNPRMATRFPHEFSGGQRQRISIARALALKPDFIVADEPISSLDVNIQAQIINLLVDLQERFGLTYLFIAHDLAVVRHICDRIVVFYLGKVVEIAPAEDLFTQPLHPYTRYLISAVPIPDADAERSRRRLPLVGEPPSAVDPPSGCRFRTRCPIAQGICAEVPPPLTPHRTGHLAACHFAGRF